MLKLITIFLKNKKFEQALEFFLQNRDRLKFIEKKIIKKLKYYYQTLSSN